MNQDALLWQAFRQGDKAAYEKIYRTYAKELYEYAYRFQVDKQLIHDCLQDLFVELWLKRERLSETNSIGFYLMKALRNRLFRSLENQKRVLNTSTGEYSFDIVLSSETSWIEQQHEEERNQQLLQAIDQLSDRQREAVYLRFYKNLDYADIAELMSLEQQSVYNLVFRALQVLRKKLSSAWLLGLGLALSLAAGHCLLRF